VRCRRGVDPDRLPQVEQQPDGIVRFLGHGPGHALDRSGLHPQAVEQARAGVEAVGDPTVGLHPVPGGPAVRLVFLWLRVEQLLVEQLREQLGDQPAPGGAPALGGQDLLGGGGGGERVGGGHWTAP